MIFTKDKKYCINVPNAEVSEELQNFLFGLGMYWVSGVKNIMATDSNLIIIRTLKLSHNNITDREYLLEEYPYSEYIHLDAEEVLSGSITLQDYEIF